MFGRNKTGATDTTIAPMSHKAILAQVAEQFATGAIVPIEDQRLLNENRDRLVAEQARRDVAEEQRQRSHAKIHAEKSVDGKQVMLVRGEDLVVDDVLVETSVMMGSFREVADITDIEPFDEYKPGTVLVSFVNRASGSGRHRTEADEIVLIKRRTVD